MSAKREPGIAAGVIVALMICAPFALFPLTMWLFESPLVLGIIAAVIVIVSCVAVWWRRR